MLRVLVLSIVLFSSGALVGWWFYYRYPPSEEMIDSSPEFLTSPLTLKEPFHSDFGEETEPANTPSDFRSFSESLEEGRTEDALTIYQRYERSDSKLARTLRHILFHQIDLWNNAGDYEAISTTLERFTEYYYQDLPLLRALAENYEHVKQHDRAIEVYLSARPYAEMDFQFNIDDRIHHLAKVLFQKHVKAQTLITLIPLLQKLAWHEPDYGFYRFALSQSYIAINDIDSAIRELEMLQSDAEYGDQAAILLASLLPPSVEPEDIDDDNAIPLAGSGGHYIVHTMVGDKYNTNLLIDTGASLTTMPDHLLKELRRNRKAMLIEYIELKTANGVRSAPVYRVKEFHIGNYVLQDIDIVALELNSSGYDGLLGMNVLNKFHFFIDQNSHTLSLTPR